MNKSDISSELSYCGEVVRTHDPDRFLLSMLCSEECREALWALFAFNYEIAKTREVVSDTKLGLIRLQWWRDAIAGIYERDEVLEHEVIKSLAQAIKVYDLPREKFDHLIYAREFDLEDVCPADLDGLLKYCDFTSTPLYELALMITGDDPNLEPVYLVAVNYALIGILRSVPHFAAQRRCLLPEDLLKGKGQSINKLYDNKRVEALSEVVRDVAVYIVPKVSPRSRLLRGAQRLSRIYLKQLKKSGFDPWGARMQVEPPFKVLRVVLSLA